ncbi:MAG: hypothetical protein BGO01_20270 [Armatimonadetes bacterium 55-13]|nr:hypothetical protein [Armatimonadota bacterium]OJU64448.1 MAG: hypothetical protein BGO01_20270 [Armatimonadetes bacterium 55-13]
MGWRRCLAGFAVTVVCCAQAQNLNSIQEKIEQDIISTQRLYTNAQLDPSKKGVIFQPFFERCGNEYIPALLQLAQSTRDGQLRQQVFAQSFALLSRTRVDQIGKTRAGDLWNAFVKSCGKDRTFPDALFQTRMIFGDHPGALSSEFERLRKKGSDPIRTALDYAEALLSTDPKTALPQFLEKNPKGAFADRARAALRLFAGIKVGQLMPEAPFAETSTGRPVDPGHLRGQVALITFSSYEHPSSLPEIADLLAIRQKWPLQRLFILTVNVDPWPLSYLKERAKDVGAAWTHVNLAHPFAPELFELGVSEVPFKLIVDTNGKVSYFGPNGANGEWKAALEGLLTAGK